MLLLKVCCGFLNRGLTTLNHYCRKSVSKKLPLKIVDVRIFTCLMHGFASKVNIYIKYFLIMYL